MSTNKQIDLIIYISPEWKSSSSTRKGNYFADIPLIKAMSNLPDLRILCVNQPFTPVETTIMKRAKAVSWIKGKRLERVGNNLFLYTPFAFVHDMLAIYSPALLSINRGILSKQIKRQLRILKFDSAIRVALVYNPLQYIYLGLAGERFKVYKCWDLFRAREYPKKVRQTIPIYERKLINDSDIILTPCTNLYKELSLLNKNTFFTPPGVNLWESNLATNGISSAPEELVGLKKPIIGFAGIISRRVDMSLIRFLGESRPDWSIVMIGNIGEGRELLQDKDYCIVKKLPNIYFLGFREFETLPVYFKYFDVCILPHSNIEVMKYAHPYKTLQYLAVGKPVVSTYIPDVQHYYADVVRIGQDHKEFMALVEESLKNNGEDDVKKRIGFAKENTWDKRAKETYEILVSHFGSVL